MAHTVADQNRAKELYCVEGKKVKEIAKILNIPTKTLYKWKLSDEWDNALKQAGNVGMALELQKQFMEEVKNAIDENRLAEPKTADALYKTSKLMEKLLPKKVMLANIYNMLEDITNYIKTLGNDKFMNYWTTFLPEISDFLRKKYND